MFAAAPLDVFMRRVLIVEEEQDTAAQLATFILENGGEPVGPVSTATDVASVIDEDIATDMAIVSMDLDLALPVIRQLRSHGIPVAWVIGDDEWFETEDDEPSVFQRQGDPDNVVRVKFPRD